MEFASQICTTREQSERLLSLGLKRETADMTIHLKEDCKNGWYVTAEPFYEWEDDLNTLPCLEEPEKIFPAWSFSRLLEIYLTSAAYRNILFVNKEDSFEYLVRHVEVYIKAGYIDENYLTEDYGTRGLQD